MATINYLKPQEPLHKIDKDTGDINYFYPLVTDDQVIMEDGQRLNAIIEDLRNNSGGTADKIMMASGLNLEQTLGGVWISFTDENGNPTSEPYIHWNEEV